MLKSSGLLLVKTPAGNAKTTPIYHYTARQLEDDRPLGSNYSDYLIWKGTLTEDELLNDGKTWTYNTNPKLEDVDKVFLGVYNGAGWDNGTQTAYISYRDQNGTARGTYSSGKNYCTAGKAYTLLHITY